MAKIQKEEPLPMTLLKIFERKYPTAFPTCDDIRTGKGVDLPDWHSICSIPISATVAMHHHLNADDFFPSSCAALYAWRKHKAIYNFDPSLAEMLMAQGSSNLDIPTEILFTIPYNCFWIQYDSSGGLFVWIEHDIKTDSCELRLLLATEDKGFTESIPVHLIEGGTVYDGIKATNDVIKENLPSDAAKADMSELMKCQSDYAAKIIQLILYLCAENKDVKKKISRSAKAKKSGVDYSAPKTWDVGFRIGNAIRKYDEAQAEAENDGKNDEGNEDHTENGDDPMIKNVATRSHRRPHTRRGHYHHFWTGSEKDDSRKIILRWVAPTFINGSAKDIVTTVHKVK